jgi:hypothetical protein
MKLEEILDSILIAILISLSRLLPHWPNVTAIGASAILLPKYFKKNNLVLILPLITLLITDTIIGWHTTMLFTYSSILLISSISYFTKINIFKSSFISSTLFFIITNFGVWIMGMYSRDMSGLMLSYTLGLPFYLNDFLGTLTYIGLITCVRRGYPVLLGKKCLMLNKKYL